MSFCLDRRSTGGIEAQAALRGSGVLKVPTLFYPLWSLGRLWHIERALLWPFWSLGLLGRIKGGIPLAAIIALAAPRSARADQRNAALVIQSALAYQRCILLWPF